MTNNQLINDILKHLEESEEARNRFNQISSILFCAYHPGQVNFCNEVYHGLHKKLSELNSGEKNLTIQTALSKTPDGKPVCESLVADNPEYIANYILYRAFTDALWHGKTFDEAIELANELYLTLKM